MLTYREVGTNEGGGKRRRWPETLKRELVAATFEPGASVSIVARRHDLNANQLFKWRRRLAGAVPMPAAVASAGLVPVEIVPAVPAISGSHHPIDWWRSREAAQEGYRKRLQALRAAGWVRID